MKNFSLTQSAELIGGKFDEDPELQIPEYPRFPEEILAIQRTENFTFKRFSGSLSTRIHC